MSYDLGTARGTIRLDYDDAASPRATNSINAIGDRASSIGSKIAGVFGKAFAAVSAAVGLAGTFSVGALVKTGLEYNSLEQTSRAAFKTILGSAEAAATMMEKIATFGKTSPFPRQAFIQATQQMLGFGISADKTIPILKSINDATAAMGGNAETIGQFSNIFSKIQSNGKITGEEIARMGDIGINAVEMLAKASGKTGEEIRKSIQSGSIDADTAITQLTEQMNLKFAGASENVKNTFPGAIDRVKGAWRDLASAIVDPFVTKTGGGIGVDAMNALADRMRKVANLAPQIIDLFLTGNFSGKDKWGMEEDDKFVVALFSIREGILLVIAALQNGASGVGDFFGGLGDAIAPLMDALAGSGGKIKDIFGTLSEVFNGIMPSIAGIAASLAGASAALGVSAWDVFLVVLQSAADILLVTLVPALEALSGYMESNSAVVTAAVAAYTAYKLVVAGISLVALIAANIALAKATLLSTVAKAKDIALTIAIITLYAQDIAIKVAHRVATMAGVAATAVATAAQWAFNAAMSANPIALVIIAIAALVAGLIWFFTQTQLGKDIFANVMNFIQTVVGAVVSWFTGTVVPGFQAAWQAIGDGLASVGQFFSDAWNNITSIVQTVIAWFQTSVAQPIAEVFQSIGVALTPLGEMFAAIWNFIVAVVLFAIGLIMIYIQLWVSAFQVAVTKIQEVMTLISTAISVGWNTIMAFISTVVAAIAAYLAGAWNNIASAIRGAMQLINNYVTSIWNQISAVVRAVLSGIGSAISNTWNSAVGAVSGPMNQIMSIVSAVWNGILSYVSRVVSNIVSAVSSGFSQAVSTVSSIWSGLLGAVTSGWNAVGSWFSGLGQRILSAVGNIGSVLANAGRMVIDGFLGGLKAAIGGVTDFFNDLTAKIPKIKGPEDKDKKMLRPAGKWILGGFKESLENEVGGVLDVLRGLNNTIPLTMDATLNPVKIGATMGLSGSGAISPISVRSADKPIVLNPKYDIKVSIGNKDITDMVDVRVEEHFDSASSAMETGVFV